MEVNDIAVAKVFSFVILSYALLAFYDVDAEKNCNPTETWTIVTSNNSYYQQNDNSVMVFHFNSDFINLNRTRIVVNLTHWKDINNSVTVRLNADLPNGFKWIWLNTCKKPNQTNHCNMAFIPEPKFECKNCIFTVEFNKNPNLTRYVKEAGIYGVACKPPAPRPLQTTSDPLKSSTTEKTTGANEIASASIKTQAPYTPQSEGADVSSGNPSHFKGTCFMYLGIGAMVVIICVLICTLIVFRKKMAKNSNLITNQELCSDEPEYADITQPHRQDAIDEPTYANAYPPEQPEVLYADVSCVQRRRPIEKEKIIYSEITFVKRPVKKKPIESEENDVVYATVMNIGSAAKLPRPKVPRLLKSDMTAQMKT